MYGHRDPTNQSHNFRFNNSLWFVLIRSFLSNNFILNAINEKIQTEEKEIHMTDI